MFGIVLISHGGLATGMLEAAGMVFGDASNQVVALGLGKEENPDDFGTRIGEAIKQVDTGEGVVILADLLGGTPCNKAAPYAGENVRIIAGVNLVMLLDILGSREAGEAFKIETALEAAHSGIADYNALLEEEENDEIL